MGGAGTAAQRPPGRGTALQCSLRHHVAAATRAARHRPGDGRPAARPLLGARILTCVGRPFKPNDQLLERGQQQAHRRNHV